MDLSKLHMYDFHYNVTKETYGDKATCSSPTPILAYKILCEDICEDMWKQREKHICIGFVLADFLLFAISQQQLREMYWACCSVPRT